MVSRIIQGNDLSDVAIYLTFSDFTCLAPVSMPIPLLPSPTDTSVPFTNIRTNYHHIRPEG